MNYTNIKNYLLAQGQSTVNLPCYFLHKKTHCNTLNVLMFTEYCNHIAALSNLDNMYTFSFNKHCACCSDHFKNMSSNV